MIFCSKVCVCVRVRRIKKSNRPIKKPEPGLDISVSEIEEKINSASYC